MTDNEIIKELQSASEWFKEHGRNTNTAVIGICDRAVDLINRQKAEIEQKSNKLREILPIVAELKSEAIKEFIAEFERRCIDGGIYPAFVKRQLEHVKEEMVGDKE